MTYRIEGWCIINSRDGSRWGSLYESETGAKASWWNWTKWLNIGHEFSEKKFNEQSVYIPQPLILLENSALQQELAEENKRLRELIEKQLACIDYQARI